MLLPLSGSNMKVIKETKVRRFLSFRLGKGQMQPVSKDELNMSLND